MNATKLLVVVSFFGMTLVQSSKGKYLMVFIMVDGLTHDLTVIITTNENNKSKKWKFFFSRIIDL